MYGDKTLTFLPNVSSSSPSTQNMTLDQLQRDVDRYIGQFKEGYWHPLSSLARVTEEVGELAREINHRYGQKPKRQEEGNKSLELELGDVLFILTSLANSLNIRLEDCMTQVMQKYQVRDHSRFERVEPVPPESEAGDVERHTEVHRNDARGPDNSGSRQV